MEQTRCSTGEDGEMQCERIKRLYRHCPGTHPVLHKEERHVLGAQESQELARRSFGGGLHSFGGIGGGGAEGGGGAAALHDAHAMMREMERFLGQGLFGPFSSWPTPPNLPHAPPYAPPGQEVPPGQRRAPPPTMRVDEV